ncbi:putative nuclease HARBI1 [Macrosteles quadrilineatus]|uniref:putative nuclease HARBI1 n=1 Tax=Macrosteles quadrilineatus TaxID=74068 RepID=UPI0023E303F7|nr:putative nuclease HARBI1 [Macrosteles quadrilineatus]
MDFFPHIGLNYVLGGDIGDVEIENRVPVVFNNRISPWEVQDRKFVKIFRLSKPLARELITTLEPHLPAARRASAIPTDIRVLTALQFMASGSYQESVGANRYLGLSQSSVSKCLHSVCDAIEPILGNYIKFPTNAQDVEAVKLGFWEKFGFPGTVGAIDCTHVAIVSPPKQDANYPEHIFVNRKNYHSINTQIVSDAERRILSIWPRFPGSTHDSFIWRNSGLRGHLQNLYHRDQSTWLIGDSGYGLEPSLIKPFEHTEEGTPEFRFNQRHRQARAIVECSIGLLKNRFRCLLRDRTLHYYPPTAAKIINCCAALHNLCLRDNVPLLLNVDERLVNDEDVPVVAQGNNANYRRALIVRDRIVRNYFN